MRYRTTGSEELFSAGQAFEPEIPGMGVFLPAEDIRLTAEEIRKFRNMDFADTVTFVLSRFCDTAVTGWDMGLLIGRTPFRVASMSHKIHIAELWHNTAWSFSFLEQNLLQCLGASGKVSLWAKIAVRIALLWGIYGQMLSHHVISPEEQADIVVNETDLSGLLSAWYAREMGMPVGTVICGCEGENPLWELMNYGHMHLGKIGESVPGLAQLLYCVLGKGTYDRFAEGVRQRSSFELLPEEKELLQQGIFISVLSSGRRDALIATLQAENGYEMSRDTATSYGALQYFRAAKTEAAPAIILAEIPPKGKTEALKM